MKKGIGLFLFLLSLDTYAGATGILMLRARVPASFSLSVNTRDPKGLPIIQSNGARVLPKITMTLQNNVRIVSVVHP